MEKTSRNPFALRDFRLLWTGEAISALGDQFALIALPWLALLLTGSAFALGSVLALMAIPRALLMVLGGAFVDRMSPRRVMLFSNAVRLVAVTILGLIVLGGAVQLWMLYVFALVFGIADAFFFPAQQSMVPEIVSGEQLGQANAIVQGTAQLSVFIGPAIAGIVIAALGSNVNSPTLQGVGAALLVDGLSFLASLATLWFIHGNFTAAATSDSVLGAIREGVDYVWRSPTLRLVILLSLAANLLIVGPFEVGVPVLAYSRLAEGAAAFGTIMSAFGAGSLVGLGAGAALPPPRPALFSTVVLGAIAIGGMSLALFAVVMSTITAVAVAFIIGVGLGYGNLMMITWLQRRIPAALMGRVMSLILLGSVGLVPISQVVSGALVQVSLSGLLAAGGFGMALLAIAALASSRIRHMGLEPVVESEASPAAAA